LWLQARYRPNLLILLFYSEAPLLVGCLIQELADPVVGQSYRPTEHFQSFRKTFFGPANAHRRKQHTV
jgi:hypothetical protein